MTDPAGATDYGTVSILVGANRAPSAADDSFVTDLGTELSVDAPGVLGNDTDANRDPLHAVLVTEPAHGTLDLRSDGSLRYQPDPDFSGTDSFTYRAADDLAESDPATVELIVSRPQARPDHYGTEEDTPLAIEAPGVLANDSDADHDPLTAVLDVGPSHGTVELHPDGSFVYTPAQDYFGGDAFTYHASDGEHASDPASVEIDVAEAPLIATVLVADPAIVPLLSGQDTHAAFVAHLRAEDGTPLPGRSIYFQTNAGNSCWALTDDDGVARCPLTVLQLTGTAVGRGYDAYFLGDADYTASGAHGTTLIVPG